jgi:hypothetical protein
MILVVAPFEEYDIPDEILTEAAHKKGKGLHSLLVKDDIRQAVIDAGFSLQTGKFKQTRSRVSSSAQRQFEDLQKQVEREIQDVTRMYLRGKDPRAKQRRIGKEAWLEQVRGSLRRGYVTSFELGLKSSGAPKFRASVSASDEEYIRQALAQEMVYFNKLLRQIEAGTFSGDLRSRLAAYADSMKHVFYAGRVMGTPTGMIIDWISPMDRNTCRSCAFLFRHSPYTKKTLPTTPRAGDTLCLNRCRCRLVMRDVGIVEFMRIERIQPRKSVYAKKLKDIKEGKALV